MFKFRNYEQCEFIVNKDVYGNISISIQDLATDTFLYQLTENFAFPIVENMVVFKQAPFVFQFLAQMQKDGLLVGGLQRRTAKGMQLLMGRIAPDDMRLRRAAHA